jgi:hypothetical protein
VVVAFFFENRDHESSSFFLAGLASIGAASLPRLTRGHAMTMTNTTNGFDASRGNTTWSLEAGRELAFGWTVAAVAV